MFDMDLLRQRLEAALPGAHITIKDLTGGRDHYAVEVISPAFEGVSQLSRHRMVYAPLKAVLGAEVHALALTTQTPAEASQTSSGKTLRIQS